MSQFRLTSGKANKREAQEQTKNSTKPPTHSEARPTHGSKKPSHANQPNQNHIATTCHANRTPKTSMFSEWHWCEPVALSAGQSGAPVSSKVCAHGREFLFRISGFSAGPLVGRVVFILDFRLTLLLLCCNALQVLC